MLLLDKAPKTTEFQFHSLIGKHPIEELGEMTRILEHRQDIQLNVAQAQD